MVNATFAPIFVSLTAKHSIETILCRHSAKGEDDAAGALLFVDKAADSLAFMQRFEVRLGQSFAVHLVVNYGIRHIADCDSFLTNALGKFDIFRGS